MAWKKWLDGTARGECSGGRFVSGAMELTDFQVFGNRSRWGVAILGEREDGAGDASFEFARGDDQENVFGDVANVCGRTEDMPHRTDAQRGPDHSRW